jgi:endonuclease YncB( thermonuclease family)
VGVFLKTFFIVGLLVYVSGISIPASAVEKVRSVTDGDTFVLTNGQKVRLLQIDAPELSSKECYGTEAKNELRKLILDKGSLVLKSDPSLDSQDQFGRLLRYAFVKDTNINLELIKLGAASPYFYKNKKGIYANDFLAAANQAQAKKIGLWKKCPITKLSPNYAVETGPINPKKYSNGEIDVNLCDPNYSRCVPVYPPDLDCSDLKKLGVAPVEIIGKDVHRLDGNRNGLGCE